MITHRNYKLIWGQEFLLDRAQPLQADKVQLYDVFQDPEERSNIASENMEVAINCISSGLHHTLCILSDCG